MRVIPWLLVLGVLGAVTVVLGAKTRDAWSDYRTAQGAGERIRTQGAVTVIKDEHLYVRVDPESLSRGKLGNWYARAVSVELREGEELTGP